MNQPSNTTSVTTPAMSTPSAPTAARYSTTAIALHWWIALFIVAAFVIGQLLEDMAFSPFKLRVISWHKWLGVSVFLLVWVRLAWRLTHRPPALPTGMSGWQQSAAHALHFLLYLLMVAVPLSGWLMSSAKGVPTVFLGVLPLPDLLSADKQLGSFLAGIHSLLTKALLVLVLAHVAAAIKHHIIDKDDVLLRMMPKRRAR